MIALAETPALPLHKAGPFVAAAYVVFVAVILIYVVVMAIRLRRNELELARLKADVRDGERRALERQDDQEALGTDDPKGRAAAERTEAVGRP